MPPVVAAIICAGFVGFLFWRELSDPNRHRISWAPFVWLFIAGSRFVSAWLDLRTPVETAAAYADGSPVDRTVFMLLIAWGAVVLSRRNIQWLALFGRNKWLVAYFAYCLASILWTEEPFILFKRWVKDLGNPIMVLVLMTERQPYDALITTIRRLSFVVLPVSVLFIKYYPEYGRGYSIAGGAMYTGVAAQKNTLGQILLIIGLCYGWVTLVRRDGLDRYGWVLVAMLCWLLYMCDSKTSQVSLFIGLTIFAVSRHPSMRGRPALLLTVTVLAVSVSAVVDLIFQVRYTVLGWLGRDPSLTHRTDIWDVLLALQAHPWVGTGFQSYWTGERMLAAWATLGAQLNQAHSGYIEQYLNLGYIGVAFIVGIAISAFTDVRRGLKVKYAWNVMRLSVITVALIYNFTEAAFYGINSMWVLLLLASIDRSALDRVAQVSPFQASMRRTRSAAFIEGPALEEERGIRGDGRAPWSPGGVIIPSTTLSVERRRAGLAVHQRADTSPSSKKWGRQISRRS
jgi:exopolysaccharide production protein ExoQ